MKFLRFIAQLVVVMTLVSALPGEAQAQDVDGPFGGLFVAPVLGGQFQFGGSFDLTLGVQTGARVFFAGEGYCGMYDPHPYAGATVGAQYSFRRKSVGLWAQARGGRGSTFLADLGGGIGPHVEWGSDGREWGLQTSQNVGPIRFRQVWNSSPIRIDLLQLEFFPKIPVLIPSVCHNPSYGEE